MKPPLIALCALFLAASSPANERPSVSFEVSSLAILEGGPAAVVKILRTGDVSAASSVVVSNLYTPRRFVFKTNIVFSPNVAEQSISLQFPDDRILEDDWSFALKLDRLSNDVVIGSIPIVTVIVRDATGATLPGALDYSFSVRNDGDGRVLNKIALQSDDRILVQGGFSRVNGSPAAFLARVLPADGTLDPTFHYAGTELTAVVPWNDKIYVAAKSPSANPLRRLNADGAEDPSFSPPTFASPAEVILSAIAVQSDGKIVAGGSFTTANGVVRVGLARFNLDGTLDTSFDAGVPFQIGVGFAFRALAVRHDGSLLVGGYFSLFNGQLRWSLAHLSSSGVLQDDFNLSKWTAEASFVDVIKPAADGSVLLACNVKLNGETARRSILRFDSSGQLDQTYSPAPGESPFAYTEERSGHRLYATGYGVHRRLQFPYAGSGLFELEYLKTVRENAGSIQVKILRTMTTSGEARIRFRTRRLSRNIDSYDAVPGVNYVPLDELVIFGDGEQEKTVAIQILNDPGCVEGGAWFEAYISSESDKAAVSRQNSMGIGVFDDEMGIEFRPAWMPGPIYRTVRESDGELSLVLRRRDDVNTPASVEIAPVGGDAIAGIDYEDFSQTAHFTNGSQEAEVRVRLIDDSISENSKTIRIALKNPIGSQIIEPSVVDVQIIDNADELILEEDQIVTTPRAGVASIKLRRRWPWTSAIGPIRVAYETEAASAQAGIEYDPVRGSVVLQPADFHSEVIQIPLIQNDIVGEPTNFRVKFAVLEGEGVLNQSNAVVTLRHPAAVIPAGSLDRRFRTFSQPYISGFAWSPQHLYLSGYLRDDAGVFRRLLRYSHDGALDTTYFPPAPETQLMIPLPNDRLMLATEGVSVGDVSGFRKIIQLDASGAPDDSFRSPSEDGGFFTAMAAADGGRFLLAGRNSEFRCYLTQALSDGTIDPGFRRVDFDVSVQAVRGIARQSDGKILVTIIGSGFGKVLRFFPDGTSDAEFTPPADLSAVSGTAPLANGKIVVNMGSTAILLNANGARDFEFTPSTAKGENSSLAAADSAGRLYFQFQRQINLSETLNFFRRFHPDGSPDADFFLPSGIDAIHLTPIGLIAQSDGHVARYFVDPPPAMGAPQFLPLDRLAFRLTLPTGAPYVIEGSADLMNWRETARGVSDSGYVRVETARPPDGAQFYRMRPQ